MTIFRAIFNFLYEIILGCSHQHLTRPFTLQKETYKVCLDCGKQIYYSPLTMRALNVREVRRLMAARGGEVRVMPSTTPALVPSSAHKSNAA